MKKTALILCLLCAACSTSGQRIDPARAAAFQEGKASRQQVEAALGVPTSASTNQGATTICYGFSHIEVAPQSFVPIIGLAIGGAKSQTEASCFSFDSRGILTQKTATQSAYQTGHP